MVVCRGLAGSSKRKGRSSSSAMSLFLCYLRPAGAGEESSRSQDAKKGTWMSCGAERGVRDQGMRVLKKEQVSGWLAGARIGPECVSV